MAATRLWSAAGLSRLSYRLSELPYATVAGLHRLTPEPTSLSPGTMTMPRQSFPESCARVVSCAAADKVDLRSSPLAGHRVACSCHGIVGDRGIAAVSGHDACICRCATEDAHMD